MFSDLFDNLFGTGSQTVEAGPWNEQAPWLTFGFDQAYQNFMNPAEYFPDATYVSFSPQTQMAMELAQNRALGGSPLEMQAQNFAMQNAARNPFQRVNRFQNQFGMGSQPDMFGLMQTAQGQNLQANPFLDDMYGAASRAMTEQFQEATMPGLNMTFGAGGRTGSGAHQHALQNAQDQLGQNLGELASNMYGQAYGTERNLQQQAQSQLGNQFMQEQGMLGNMLQQNQNFAMQNAQQLPQLAAIDWNNIAQLSNVGQQVEGKAQEALQDRMNRFQFYQDAPERNLQNFMQAIMGNYGSTQKDKGVDSGWMGDAGRAIGGLGNLLGMFF